MSIHVVLADIPPFEWLFIGKLFHEVVLYFSVFLSKLFFFAMYLVLNAVSMSSLQLHKEVFEVPILAVDELILIVIVTLLPYKLSLVLLKLNRILVFKTFKVSLELLIDFFSQALGLLRIP